MDMESNNSINTGPSTSELLLTKRQFLVSAIEVLNKELNIIDTALNSIKSLGGDFVKEVVNTNTVQSKINLDNDIDWKPLFENLFKNEGRVLKSREITSLLFPNKVGDEFKKIGTKVANSLNYIAKRPKPLIKIYKTESPITFYYGLSEWFEEDNSLKDEYLNKIEKAA